MLRAALFVIAQTANKPNALTPAEEKINKSWYRQGHPSPW
jgi:hypothetical protein